MSTLILNDQPRHLGRNAVVALLMAAFVVAAFAVGVVAERITAPSRAAPAPTVTKTVNQTGGVGAYPRCPPDFFDSPTGGSSNNPAFQRKAERAHGCVWRP